MPALEGSGWQEASCCSVVAIVCELIERGQGLADLTPIFIDIKKEMITYETRSIYENVSLTNSRSCALLILAIESIICQFH